MRVLARWELLDLIIQGFHVLVEILLSVQEEISVPRMRLCLFL